MPFLVTQDLNELNPLDLNEKFDWTPREFNFNPKIKFENVEKQN